MLNFVLATVVLAFGFDESRLSLEATTAQEMTMIVALGDSLTDGYGIPQQLAYPSIVERKLRADGYNVSIINSGISGSTTASAEGRLKWLLKSPPQVVFLALGANDGLRGVGLKSTKENLRKAIQLAKSKGIKVWLAGMKLPPNYGQQYSTGFEEMFRDLAAEEQIPLLPFLLEGVAGDRDLNQPDGLHPNEEGQKVIADKVYQFFKEQL